MAQREHHLPIQESTEPTPPEGVAAQVESAPGSRSPRQAFPSRQKKRGLPAVRVGIIVFCLLGFLLALLPDGRASLRAAVLLPALMSARASAPLALLGEPIRQSQVTLTGSSGLVFLEVYAPTSLPPLLPGERQAIVLVPGVGDNRERPQLVNLAESLARAGIVVVILTTPTLIVEQLVPTDADAVIQAFAFASHWPGVGSGRVGIVAFSAGSVLACLAAADARIRGQVAFVVVVGGVFHLPMLLEDVGRRAMLVDGQSHAFQPDAVTIRVLAKTMTRMLPPAEGQVLVATFASGGQPPGIPEQIRSSPGIAAYHLLAGDAPTQVEAKLAALSPPMKALLRDLSPSRVIDQMQAPLYLLHDRSDPYIPFTQARDFAAALARLGHPHDLAEFDLLHHAEVTLGASPEALIIDSSKLYWMLRTVLKVGA
jgi:acetyl esterase/lipase